jgi:hypothetical protein
MTGLGLVTRGYLSSVIYITVVAPPEEHYVPPTEPAVEIRPDLTPAPRSPEIVAATGTYRRAVRGRMPPAPNNPTQPLSGCALKTNTGGYRRYFKCR